MSTLKQKIELIVIDPQNDFCASGANGTTQGSLFVPGADADMDRLTDFIDRVGHKLHDIHVTLDSHAIFHLSNPIFWVDSRGNRPSPFTHITVQDVVNGTWTTKIPSHADLALKYLKQLEATKRYEHTIWPFHCIIGEWGHGVYPKIAQALRKWCEERPAIVDFVAKGSNPFTEHFSAVRAEVPDPKDPSTQLNTRLITTLENADQILIAGEALSHCLANTVVDVANAFANDSYIKKIVLLEDCTSPVPGFEKQAESFVKEMKDRGMTVTTSDKYLV